MHSEIEYDDLKNDYDITKTLMISFGKYKCLMGQYDKILNVVEKMYMNNTRTIAY